MVNSVANTMSAQILEIVKRIENAISQAHLHSLSPLTLSHEVLKSIQKHINVFAKEHSYQSFVSRISDLFQIEASFVYQPHNSTCNILLHVPLVKPEFLLSLHQSVYSFPIISRFFS